MIFCPKTDYMSVRHVKTCSWYIQYFTQKHKVLSKLYRIGQREREREREREVHGLIHHRQMNSTRLCAYLINNPIFIDRCKSRLWSIEIESPSVSERFAPPFPFLLKYSYLYFRVLNWQRTSVYFLFKYTN